MYRENINERGGKIKYALREGAEADVEKALTNITYTEDVYLTESSPTIVASQKGVRNLPMLMKASHIRENVLSEREAKSLGLKIDKHIHYHGLGKSLFLRVIDGLENVTLAYRGTKNANNPSRRENYFILISQYKDAAGNVINIPVYIDETGQYNRVFMDTNRIATVYGKDNFFDYINREIRYGNLVRIKTRSTRASELQTDNESSYNLSASDKDIIPEGKENVNLSFSTDYSLSNPGEQNAPIGSNPIYSKDIVKQDLLAPVREDVLSQQTAEEYYPLQESKDIDAEIEEANARLDELYKYGATLSADSPEISGLIAEANSLYERINELKAGIKDQADSLTDADMPPVRTASRGYEAEQAANTFADRSFKDVSNRKVKAYIYENPEVKPFFQQEAGVMLEELAHTIKGERWYNEQLQYDSWGKVYTDKFSRKASVHLSMM